MGERRLDELAADMSAPWRPKRRGLVVQAGGRTVSSFSADDGSNDFLVADYPDQIAPTSRSRDAAVSAARFAERFKLPGRT